jgi:hypothetical protein
MISRSRAMNNEGATRQGAIRNSFFGDAMLTGRHCNDSSNQFYKESSYLSVFRKWSAASWSACS